MALIEIMEDKCRRCYACVRICPVQAIKVDAKREIPEVLENRCISCGSCVTSCKPEAIVYQDSKEEVKALLNSGEKVAAIVALSISGEFTDISDYRKFVEMIRRLGFVYVHEVSFGVDLVAQKYAELFQNNRGKNYVTSTCPAVFYYIEKFHPELVENLAPIVSPMIASAKVIHSKYGTDVKVVYIGPCIASKTEAFRYKNTDGQTDAVMTFHELRQLFADSNIKESMLEFSDFDAPFGYKGSLYPISNGLLQAGDISEDLLHGRIITTEGRNNMIEAVREIEQRPETINRHFNIFYDEGGCMMGPGTTRNGKRFLRRTLVINYTKKRLRNFDTREWAKNMKLYSSLDLSTSFVGDDQRIPVPSKEKLIDVLKTLGRQEASQNLSCGSCGYESCQEFAMSVAKGLTKIDMCFNYSLRSRQEHIKNLKLTNEELAKTQDALQNSEKVARHEQQLAKDAMETIETMLQKLPSSIVIVDENLRVIQANQTLIEMLGPEAEEINEVIPGLVGADIKTLLPYQIHNLFSYVMLNGEDIQNRDIHLNDQLYNISVFTIRKNKIVGAVMRDMQSPEIRKEEVVKRVSEVIDKNLEMVQKIGFLLGEGAAETEQMLNSIIEFYKSAKK
jgi:iron only hydrogenase large subunit-like protein